ncbi:MAG: hypothetical protein R3208_12580 [Ketobacteraceae bacterium]|nr:hypothetical protein [Ketobacteraceae bacterium]
MAPFLFAMTKKLIVPLIILAAAIGVYWPGMNGPFVFDDFYNFVDNPGVQIESLSLQSAQDAIAASTSGPLKRPIPVLSLSLNYYFSGLEPFSYKLVNLLIHLLNGLLVYGVFVLVLRVARVAGDSGSSAVSSSERLLLALLAGAWLLHPLNLTSVLYVVQRMNSMATLFMLLALACYLKARLSADSARGWCWLLGALLSGVAAIFCKENAAVLFFVVLALELSLTGFASLCGNRDVMTRLLRWLFGLILVGLVVAVAWYFSALQAGFESRPYSMGERLLTQGRALVFYISQIILPNSTRMALFHDEIRASTSLLEPLTTLWSVVFLVVVTAVVLFVRKKQPLVTAGWFWFLGGHLIESSIFPLELVHEHRNYFPMLGLFLMGFVLLKTACDKFDSRKVLVILVAYICVLGSVTFSRANDWSSWAKLVLSEAAKNPESARSNFEAARYYFGLLQIKAARDPEKAYEFSRRHFLTVSRVDEHAWYGYAGLIRLDDLMGYPTDERVWKAFYERLAEKNVQHMDMNQFLGMLDCQMGDDCSIEPEKLLKAVDAALANPDLIANRKRYIANAATALSLKYRQLDRAQEYSLQVISYNESLLQSYKNALEIARLRNDAELEEKLLEQVSQQVEGELPEWANPQED